MIRNFASLREVFRAKPRRSAKTPRPAKALYTECPLRILTIKFFQNIITQAPTASDYFASLRYHFASWREMFRAKTRRSAEECPLRILIIKFFQNIITQAQRSVTTLHLCDITLRLGVKCFTQRRQGPQSRQGPLRRYTRNVLFAFSL